MMRRVEQGVKSIGIFIEIKSPEIDVEMFISRGG